MSRQSPEELQEDLARRERELRAVHRITASLHARTSPDELVRQTLLAAIETVEASAGSLLLHDAGTDRLVFRHVVGPTDEIAAWLSGREIAADQGVAGAVFRGGQGMITPDAAAETRHYREIDRATRH